LSTNCELKRRGATQRLALHAGIWLALFVVPPTLTGCTYGRYTTRVVNGQTVRGRAVDADAYSEYLAGVMLETQGEWNAAYDTYQRALRYDRESPEIWTRLGVAACHGEEQDRASDAFDKALDLDPQYAPAWLALAKCEFRRERTDAALAAAIRAVGLSPRNVEATMLVAQILETQGKREEALAWLRGLVSLVPNDPRAWRALRKAAIAAGDPTDEARADRTIASIRNGDSQSQVQPPPLADLDLALVGGDLARARAVATDHRLSPSHIAVRAAALGEYGLALKQARLVWRADPNNTDAWIALLVAEDALAQSGATPDGTPGAMPSLGLPPHRVPSPLATRLFASLLAKRLGPQAAAAWLAAAGPLPSPRDPVEVGLEKSWTEPRQ
jgi:tetratricopeptide (TPR) repeat protein